MHIGLRNPLWRYLVCFPRISRSFELFPKIFRDLAHVFIRDYAIRSDELNVELQPELLRPYDSLIPEVLSART
jgi:hypothetical protein